MTQRIVGKAWHIVGFAILWKCKIGTGLENRKFPQNQGEDYKKKKKKKKKSSSSENQDFQRI